MPSRTRRIIAGTGLAAGLLVGSIAPAAALPGEPNDRHCERIERFEERALDRIDRIEAQIDRTERVIDRFEARAEARPERADRWERRIERMNAKVDRLRNRIDRLVGRYDAIAEHCGVDPLYGQPADEPAVETPVDDTPADNPPVEDTVKPEAPGEL